MWISRTCKLSIFSFGLTVLSGCAHTPGTTTSGSDPKYFLERACNPGKDVAGYKGSVWLKAKSKEVSGQFPASVLVHAPDSLKLEVTNLVGGTEAVITVQGQEYTIEVPKRPKQAAKGSGSWGGIPLRWATQLFLGRIPCPSAEAQSSAKLSMTAEGDLIVEAAASLDGGSEKFTYRFRKWAGTDWPASLRWEKLGQLGVAVDFKFDDPEDKTHSPRKWEAKSDQGEVKVRWKDRERSS